MLARSSSPQDEVFTEETMPVLAQYHRALGQLVFRHEGTFEHFAGDGLTPVGPRRSTTARRAR